MLDEHDADAGVGNFAQQVAETRLVVVRQAGGGLVQQQHVGLGGERTRDLDQSPVDVRQIAGPRVRGAGVAAEFEQRGVRSRAGGARSLRAANGGPRRPRHSASATLSATIECSEQLRRLISSRDAAPRDPERAPSNELFVSQGDRARGGTIVTAQHVEHRRLACAVGADESGDRRGRHRESEIADRAQAPELHRESGDLERTRRPVAALAQRRRRSAVRAFERPRTFAPAPAGEVSLHQPGNPVRGDPEHHKQQRAEEQQPVILETRQRLRQHPDDDRTNDGTGERTGAADHHDEHEQDRLQEMRTNLA